ncbi:hypothetical protein GOV11_04300 [Candidatus Woesearchaeota archaeon]|nr:hypothetical protein [Candidatus Woesearchaeota archaeon]
METNTNDLELSPKIDALFSSMALAQIEFEDVDRGKTNDFLNYRYATLKQIQTAIRKPFANNGLVHTQHPISEVSPGGKLMVGVTTLIVHAKSGQWMKSSFKLPLSKMDPQAAGSALTYAERYTLAAIVGLSIADVDDDAHSATYTAPVKTAPRPPQNVFPDQMDQRLDQINETPREMPNMGNDSMHGNPGEFMISFGKHKGKRIQDCPEIVEYANWLDSQPKKNDRSIELIGAVQAYQITKASGSNSSAEQNFFS